MLIVINASHLVSHMRLWIFMNPKSLYVNNAVDPLTFPTVKFPEYKWMRYHKICNTYSSLQLSVCFFLPKTAVVPAASQSSSDLVKNCLHSHTFYLDLYNMLYLLKVFPCSRYKICWTRSYDFSLRQRASKLYYYLQAKHWEVMRKTALNDSTLIFNQDGELDKLTNITMKIFYFIIQRSFWWVQSCDWSIITWEIKTEMRAEACLKRFACVTEALYFYSVPS